MRRRGVGIIGVAAVAHVASKKGAQAGAQQQAAADQASQQQEAAAAPAAPAPAAAPAVDPTMAELQNLANLHTQGILSDEEFAAAKAKVLGI
jgi:membrane protease subunit (stomatin/prohibitin family)